MTPPEPRDDAEARRAARPEALPWTLRTASAADVHDIAVFQTETWREAYRDVVDPAYLAAVGVPERVASWGLRVASPARHVVVARVRDAAPDTSGDDADDTPGDDARGPSADDARGEVAGVVSWAHGDLRHDPFDLDLVELTTLYVGAAHRGGGLADALLRKALGDGAAYLWAFERNARALAFYARHGFVADGTRKLDVPTGAWERRLVRPPRPAPGVG
ncbi:GNAT family N-acetyltransferase [Frigoribacterium sp. CFBP 13707]|uniref:GNAT family N-acetyltransferase n=1 Tax=Frigoribacterium sp. CFBP 13707 TaxID=2775313 RepID=UPI00177BAE56|nr:GNAT family N-acetyltransferase [Frigoribacterium sp. CFBP 13707]MBD8729060.1 GNAT family N-acetyltransferase [Frigoribacterium sp. CFBP 13707]